MVNTSFGKVADLLEGDCPHVNFFRNVNYTRNEYVDSYEEEELILRQWPDQTSVSFGLNDVWSITHTMELVAKKEVSSHPGRALELDPQWIDDRVVRGWITTCDDTHDEGCKSRLLFRAEDSVQPTYLVDTLNDCLIQGNGEFLEYVALSYVWGGTETLRNESKVLRQLQSPGVLASGENALRIPQTVKDAFAITKHLGKRYLWVDALCIVQDNMEHLRFELDRMHRIYACATFTIIAADGTNSSHGLRGFRHITSPRELRQRPFQLDACEQIIHPVGQSHMGYTWENEIPLIYYDRAWTFQEMLFSKRRLIFQDNIVRWHCQTCDWREDILPHGKVEYIWSGSELWLENLVPGLGDLSDIIGDYNTRTLTYPEDAFSAFAGIQMMLHRIFPFGLIYGHPEIFFDIALNWNPREPVTRRKPARTPGSGTNLYSLPSWSWVGWAGELRFPWDHEFEKSEETSMVGYVEPVTKWYAIQSPLSAQRRQINSVWHKYRSLARVEEYTLPQGWSREIYDLDPTDSTSERLRLPRNIPRYYFKHTSSPEEAQAYWYPVPVLPPNSTCVPQPQTAFLFAQTSRAFLYTGKIISRNYASEPPRVQITNAGDQRVGYLLLHNKNDLADLGFDPENGALGLESEVKAKTGKLIELVATCKGYSECVLDYTEMYASSSDEAWVEHIDDCCFVLWIEWEDGVAYRRGCGAVLFETWENERETELVDLILG
ncbi:MAG: hypothetical protein Q9218_007845 [Villophora microphyllina]